MVAAPAFPVGDDGGHGFEFGSLQRAVHSLSQNVTPERLRLGIDHDETALPKLTGDGEGESLVVYFAGIHDAIVAEMSPGSRDIAVAQLVIDDFATRPGQHINWVRPGLVANRNPQHQLIVLYLGGCFVRSDRRRIGDRGEDSIDNHLGAEFRLLSMSWV